MTPASLIPVPISKRAFRLALWILPLFALTNVVLLVVALDGSSLRAVLVEPELLLFAALLIFVPWLTNALRLILWSRFLNLRMQPRQVLRVVTGTIIANAVTPSTTGGPAVKWVLLAAEGVPTDKVNTLISFQVAEDTSTLIPLVTVALITLSAGTLPGISALLDGKADYFASLLTITVVVAALLVALAARGALGKRIASSTTKASARLRKYGNALLADWREMMRTGKSVALITTTLAAVQWIARFSIATLVIGAAGATMQPALHWFLQWAVQTLGSVVPTPGGAGGAEAAFLIFFAPFLGENELVPAMTIWRLVFFYLPLTAAAVLFFILGTRREEEAKNTQP